MFVVFYIIFFWYHQNHHNCIQVLFIRSNDPEGRGHSIGLPFSQLSTPKMLSFSWKWLCFILLIRGPPVSLITRGQFSLQEKCPLSFRSLPCHIWAAPFHLSDHFPFWLRYAPFPTGLLPLSLIKCAFILKFLTISELEGLLSCS